MCQHKSGGVFESSWKCYMCGKILKGNPHLAPTVIPGKPTRKEKRAAYNKAERLRKKKLRAKENVKDPQFNCKHLEIEEFWCCCYKGDCAWCKYSWECTTCRKLFVDKPNTKGLHKN